MQIRTEKGIVFKTVNFSETSVIIHIFTRTGIYNLIAKGARRMKSKLRSVTSKMTYGEFSFYDKGDKLGNLIEFSPLNNFNEIHTDIEKISYASYIVDFLTQVYNQNNDEEIFNLMLTAFDKISEGLDPRCISFIVEIQSLKFLGVDMKLDSCLCGSKKIKTFSFDNASFICDKCLQDEKVYSLKSLAVLKLFKECNLEELENISLEDKTIKEINEIIYNYLDDYTGLYLKTRDMISKVLQ